MAAAARLASTADDFRRFCASAHVHELTGHRKKVHGLAWNHTGTLLASGAVDLSVRLWTTERLGSSSRACAGELKGHTGTIEQLCWNPVDENQLATASADRTVRVWDVRMQRASATVTTAGENLNICWSPDGQALVVGSKQDVLTVIDPRKGEALRHYKSRVQTNEMHFEPSGQLLLVGTGAGTIDFLSFPDMEKVHSLFVSAASCYSISLDPTGVRFAVGGADASVSVWDLRALACLRACTTFDNPVRTVAWSYDGQYVAASGEDPFIDLIHADTGASTFQIPSRTSINAMIWHPKAYLLAYAVDDADRDAGLIRVFDASNSIVIPPPPALPVPVASVPVSGAASSSSSLGGTAAVSLPLPLPVAHSSSSYSRHYGRH